GFIRYEVSNFSKPTFESQHNFKYWNEVEYLGLGVSSHSYIKNYRYNNTKRLDKYIQDIELGELPIDAKEYLNFENRRTERIMLSLRMATGLDLEKFK
ncbi:MAG: coproporphyrinogen III oxidase family protein, partial [Clostridia bacterium]|nr:coproporphyrinogen III oxidase family protein [Clostridia bacterium]